MAVYSSLFLNNVELLFKLVLVLYFAFMSLCIVDYIKDLGKHTKSQRMKIIREDKELIEKEEYLYQLYKERGRLYGYNYKRN